MILGLRLFPPVPLNNRTVTKTTMLPTGGGPDGESPILVRKGELVVPTSTLGGEISLDKMQMKFVLKGGRMVVSWALDGDTSHSVVDLGSVLGKTSLSWKSLTPL